ncbi:MAG: hypothetical protein ACJ74O_13955 [Frankiaceae bacterium]
MAQTRKQVRRSQHAEAEARNAVARAAAARAQRRKHLLARIGIVVGAVAVVAAIAVPVTMAMTGDHSGLPKVSATGREVGPPWPAPAHPLAAAREAGLRSNQMEGTVVHYHAHLDILVNGKPATVPGNLGIDTTQGQLAEVHTHDATGVIHIEAPDKGHRYVLGQVFAEWDVRLDATHLGGLVAGDGKALRAYVNGKQVSGNPARIELKPHEEIALVYGPAGAKVDVPKSYAFQNGE